MLSDQIQVAFFHENHVLPKFCFNAILVAQKMKSICARISYIIVTLLVMLNPLLAPPRKFLIIFYVLRFNE